MNELEGTVTAVLGSPKEQFGHWVVAVNYMCWGSVGFTLLSFDTLEEAQKVRQGYKVIV